jgi:hypothetical protein
MSKFNFINSPEFRDSLENDHSEMQTAINSRTWKAAQVLAGSIVEALLVDHIISAKIPIPGTKDPLRLELAEAITICRTNKIISDRAADLCSVIRSYRNLIHPGRQIRLGEDQPSQQSAEIASALVHLITDDLAKVRRGIFGFTAEQIVAKLEKDHNALTLLPHLLKEVHENEIDRILSGVLSARYFELDHLVDPDNYDSVSAAQHRLTRGYRIVFSSAPEQLKKKATQRFVMILKNEEGLHIDSFADSFFDPDDFRYVSEKDKPMVKEYLFSKLPSAYDPAAAERAISLAPLVESNNMKIWLDPFVRALVILQLDPDERNKVRKILLDSQFFLSGDAEKLHDKRLTDWSSHFNSTGQKEQAVAVNALLTDAKAARLPF